MLIILLLYISILSYGCRFGEFDDYLSKEKTSSIKGLFILLVFFSHFNGYVIYNNYFDLLWLKIISLFGQTMVTLFLFYSGYGVMESIKKKGKNYVETIPKKRIFITILKFDLAVLIFTFFKIILREPFTLKHFVLSLIGLESMGNSNWYIFAILMMYLITYISFKLYSDNDYLKNLLIHLFLTLVYMIGIKYILNKELWWYDTVLCYNVGMFYSFYSDKINRLLSKEKIYFTILSCLFILTIFLKQNSNNVLNHFLLMISFALLIVIITKKISLDNKVLRWFGNNLFEIYILQRIPMVLFSKMDIIYSNLYLYFVVCFFSTLIIAAIFKFITAKVLKYLNS